MCYVQLNCEFLPQKTRVSIKCDTSAAASRSATKPIHVGVLCFSSVCIKYEIKKCLLLKYTELSALNKQENNYLEGRVNRPHFEKEDFS